MFYKCCIIYYYEKYQFCTKGHHKNKFFSFLPISDKIDFIESNVLLPLNKWERGGCAWQLTIIYTCTTKKKKKTKDNK